MTEYSSNPQISNIREKEIRHVTLWGALGNMLLLIFKFFAGIMGHSAAMIADAVHSLSDFATDVVVLLFVRLAGKPKDRDHAYGHGKYETLGTAIIGLSLIGIGLGILWNGVTTVYAIYHGEKIDCPGTIALIAALVSIVVKEILYQYTAIKGRRLNSPAMIANAWHHRSDAFSSIGTSIGIGGAILLGDSWIILDPLAAIIVSLLIVRAAYKLLLPCIDELLERALPEEEEQFIYEVIGRHTEVSDPHNLRTRRIGEYRAIEMHIRMNGETTISEAHKVTRDIEETLRERFGKKTIINTHVEPTKGA
jgi:cation diffusion facilitator family transporter